MLYSKTIQKSANAENIVMIYNHAISSDTIKDKIEDQFVNLKYGLTAKMAYARHKSDNPFLAKFYKINGAPWIPRMICGDNSCLLYARQVTNLEILINNEGKEILQWEELMPPIL